jgi:hypothetical protein
MCVACEKSNRIVGDDSTDPDWVWVGKDGFPDPVRDDERKNEGDEDDGVAEVGHEQLQFLERELRGMRVD